MYRQEGTFSHSENKFTTKKLIAAFGALAVLAVLAPSPSAATVTKVMQLQKAAEQPQLETSMGPR